MSKQKKKRLPRKPTEYAEESRAIRISPELDNFLREMRHRKESYDNVLRRLLGMHVTKYEKDAAQILWAVDDGETLSGIEAVAMGLAVMKAVKAGKKKPFPVKKLRTVP